MAYGPEQICIRCRRWRRAGASAADGNAGSAKGRGNWFSLLLAFIDRKLGALRGTSSPVMRAEWVGPGAGV